MVEDAEVAEAEAPPALATALRARSSEILATWVAAFEQSKVRFRRMTKAAGHTGQVASLIDALAVASHDLRPGSDAAREIERNAAYIGARFASEGATGFDVAALLIELRNAVAHFWAPFDDGSLAHMFEWLIVIAQDAFATAGMQSLRERQSEQLEVGTPIVELLPKVPAVFLVGAASAPVIDGLLSRAWMLAVGTGAPCLVIECNGLVEVGDRDFETGYQAFLAQAEGSALQILLVGARRALRDRVVARTLEVGLTIQLFERVDGAVAHAIERAGYSIVRHP
ncbi:MAG: hypothetical protein NT062_21280 [Proteobacteria bacterium]|nr:hypothetical protein [Pseudomonadota bacterium]